ncbi:hypothetical protein L6164_027095 [Bauhinia variegata]|uniref:Uncharacterized protein n=1 Tax=Bauhinia variegata TaxID=167791 RepID=A0ACB9LS71_BAUVA|nr:hypothetical protein L6164_027095 [Bauhinia variegata]
MTDFRNWACQNCGNKGLNDGGDGFFYCTFCNSQAEDIIDTGVADEDFVDKGGETGGAIYLASHRRRRSTAIKAEPISQYDSFYDSQSQFLKNLGLEETTPQRQDHGEERTIKVEEYYGSQFDEWGPSVPEDFGGSSSVKVPSFDDYYNEIRLRYVLGLQMMIEFQCEALVKEFKVSPLICGLIGPIWLRFVSTTGVFDDEWADQAIKDSEMQHEEDPEYFKPRVKYRAEPHSMYGDRAVLIWFRSLREMIPLPCTVAISFLACHITREAVLPTDIMKWTLEGKLPYFSAFCEIERRMGPPSRACPISSSFMFRPSKAVSLQKLESLAASIAQSIGLELPPVNFYEIALRYLEKLSLPVEKIVPHACRIYEWSMPPDLWLSSNDLRLPTRVYVMSILIVAIRILYNINGFGEWEKSLSHMRKVDGGMNTTFASQDGHDFRTIPDNDPLQEMNAAGLLHHLEARYNEIADTYEFAKDLSTYLQYCKDVVFAGLEASCEDHEEEKMIEYLWDVYQNEKDSEPVEPVEQSNISFNQRSLRDEIYLGSAAKEKKNREACLSEPLSHDGTCLADDLHRENKNIDHSTESSSDSEDSESNEHTSADAVNEEAIRQMKLDMAEKRFCYIPPRTNVKRFDYLHYVRKKGEGAYTYVAHTDYYILLRACAVVAQVDIRIMHIGVLRFERRLAWLEKRIDHCLNLRPSSSSCQFCTDVAPENGCDDTLGLSNLNI